MKKRDLRFWAVAAGFPVVYVFVMLGLAQRVTGPLSVVAMVMNALSPLAAIVWVAVVWQARLNRKTLPNEVSFLTSEAEAVEDTLPEQSADGKEVNPNPGYSLPYAPYPSKKSGEPLRWDRNWPD